MPDWISRIHHARQEEKGWRDEAKNAIEVYRKAQSRRGFNILWPNTSIKHAAVFGRKPEPVVRPRSGSDQITRQISLMLERAILYQMDVQPDWMDVMNRTVLDWLLPGRGVTRVRYVPEYQERTESVFTDDEGRFFSDSNLQIPAEDIVPNGEEAVRKVREVVAEEARIEHVPWTQFTHDPQQEWDDVRWMAFHHRMHKTDAVRAFGKKKANGIVQIGHTEEVAQSGGARDANTPGHEPRLSVWEVWDRESGTVAYVGDGGAQGGTVELESYDDPYKLRGFFPIPRPLRAVTTPGTTLPVCEYTLYSEQAHELNVVTTQLSRLLRQVRVKGIYDSSMGESIGRLARNDDHVLVPVDNWLVMRQTGGLNESIEYLPFVQAAQAAGVLSEYRAQLLDTIYQIIGLSDIMRGASDPRETASAQNLKSQFGGLRLRPQQEEIQRYIATLIGMQVELMAEKFDIPTLEAMSRMQAPPMTELIIRSDVLRQFAVDVETDSTIASDDQARKAERAEFLQAFAAVLGQATQAQAAGFLDQRAVAEVIKFGLAPYRVSRELEEALDGIGQQQQEQQPDLAAQAALMKAQVEQSKVQLEAQDMQQRAAKDSAEFGLDVAQFQHQRDVDRERLMLDALKIAEG